ncbi:hypothetical protein B0A52_10305 [Exophiala mesophila]|uniref:Uncharacterized protein n=1 Tax=Exophiala mesophila TaxID=212818 RepID=A0A438MSD6_EXOME|nr:hypothetical protein B0A52_10305 [Exophiala mesophila]
MAVDQATLVQLIQQLEADRKAYLSTFEKVNETLSRALHGHQPDPYEVRPGIVNRSTMSSEGSLQVTAADQSFLSLKRPHSTNRRQSEITTQPNKNSIFTGDDSSDSDSNDESFFVQETLPPYQFDEEDLIVHLRTHNWDKYSRFMLQDLLDNVSILSNFGIFHKDRHLHLTGANHQHADIYHVSTDGAPLRHSRGDSEEGPLATWEALKCINTDNSRKLAVGRIIVLREPPSSLLAALHLTMKDHFDMDSIYRLLIDDDTPTRAITKGFLKTDHRRQRSIVFVFKYHTVVGEGRAPLPWQSHDDNIEERKGDNIALSTCSAVVALSLAGRPSHTLRRNSRKTKSIVGQIYDPFAPWHVLSIQAFPDWKSSVETHNTNHHYVNGPDAFLVTLLAEYRDAVKRFKEVHRQITHLATPPNKSIFDSALRDELLFENDQYTYSRRYFWASQTLGVLSNEIKDMINAYRETFSEDFWTGEHKTLFPGTKEQSSKYGNWRKKLSHTRKQFEKEIQNLEEVLKMFSHQQKEIRGLREWLFSGTSVFESRDAVGQAKITVEQGYNIRLLTMVTLFYLPLQTVTSIFGMTNMPEDDGYLPFALATLGICIPTYLIIVVVNNPEKVRYIVTTVELAIASLFSCAIPKQKVDKLKKKIEHQREKQLDSQPGHTQRRPMIRKAATATHASFEARLSADMALDPIRHASQSIVNGTRRMSQTLSHHLPTGRGGAGRKFLGHLVHTSDKMPKVTESDVVPPHQADMNSNSVDTPSTPPLAAFGRYNRTSTIPIDELTYSNPRRSQTVLSSSTVSNTSPSVLYPEGIISRDMERSATFSPASHLSLSPGTTPPPPSPGRRRTQSNDVNGSATARHGPSPTHLPVVDRSLLRRWTDWYSPLERSTRVSRVNTPETPSPKEQV